MVGGKLHFDLYLDHWSFWLDFQILLATVLRVLGVPTPLIALLFRVSDAPDPRLASPSIDG